MLHGRFVGSAGRPYIGGRLVLLGISLRAEIPFLVDTGDDRTTLFPFDSYRMGIDFSKLPGDTREGATGVGGRARSKTLPALVAFDDPGRNVYVYDIDLTIMEPNEEIEGIPSLLGRDVLNRWIMRYAYPTRRLTFSVASADYVYTETPG